MTQATGNFCCNQMRGGYSNRPNQYGSRSKLLSPDTCTFCIAWLVELMSENLNLYKNFEYLKCSLDTSRSPIFKQF